MSKINFPKKQEQRLIPKYLLEYAEELQENHPDPSAEWGGSGGDVNIEAGTGITITTESDDTKVISLDTNPSTFEVTATTGMTLEVENSNPLWKDSKLQMTSVGATRLEGTQISLEANNIYLNSDNAPFYVNNTTHEYKTLATTDQITNVSGTNDGTDWTSLTIGNDTYGLASGGTTYTAGTGINISNEDVISVDNTVAMKTDIPDVSNMVTTDTNQTLTGQKTWGSGTLTTSINNYSLQVNDNNRSIIYTNQGMQFDMYNSAYNKVYLTMIDHNTTPVSTTGQYVFVNGKKGNVAIEDDIPTATSDLTNDSGYITGINSSDVITALGYTPGTSNFSGSYNDLTNKPDLSIYAETADLGDCAYLDEDELSINYSQLTNTPTIPVVPTNVSAFTNDAGYITGINSSDVIAALGYTPGTSNFSGSYNDLTNKPDLSIYAESADLATVATTGSYNDLTDKPTIPDTTYMVTTNTNQNITGVKTFYGEKLVNFRLPVTETKPTGFTCYTFNNTEKANLQFATRTVSGNDDYYLTLGNYSLDSNKAKVGFRLQDSSNNSYNFIMPTGTSSNFTSAGYTTSANNYIPCSFTNGTTTVNANSYGSVNINSLLPTVPTTATSTSTLTPTTIQLTFTYTDDTTETVTLMTAATVSTTTTLS